MRTKVLFIALVSIITVCNTYAQKRFSLEELNFGGKNAYKFIPQRWDYRWWGNKLIDGNNEANLFINPETGKAAGKNEIDMHNILSVYGFDIESAPHINFGGYPYGEYSYLLNNFEGKRYLIDFTDWKVVWSQSSEGSLEWNKTSRADAFIRDNNLWVRYSDGSEVPISNDGSREIVYGKSVHRDEFGITKGTFWNPEGTKLAFYRMDQSMVADYPQVNTFKREAELEPDKYPMAGMTSHKVTIGIFDLKTKKTNYLNLGDVTDRYFTNITWDPNGNILYLYELNREQNHCTLDAYNVTNGNKIKTLYSEDSGKYIEPLHTITFLPWNKNKFIYWSWKDGYNHLYMMDVDGKELVQITKGKWVVLELIGFCHSNNSIIIKSKETNDLQENLYSLNLKTLKRTPLDNGKGVHQAKLSDDGCYLVDTWQEPTVPRMCAVTNTKTGKSKLLATATDPWKGWYQPIFESGKIKAADGITDLYWRMVKPADFDPSKKYPTVVYVYGGPHAHNVEASWHWDSRSWETYMAQKGYIIFVLDNRGSENRGRDFEQVTFRHLGQEEMKDQICGVDYLKSLPYVDSNRLGVHGWSFGGFMTVSLMTNYPEIFKVGVAGGPVIDWKYYEVMYGERYMDTPDTNKEGYEQTSLLNKAKNLKGKLQLIIGMNDPTVVPQHTLQFINACTEVGTQPDLFVYPGEGHNMMGHKSVHLHERITQYFEDYLK